MPPPVIGDVRFEAVTPATWPLLEQLFEARGGPKNCWCMAWRGTAGERRAFSAAMGVKDPTGRASSSAVRKAALKSRVDAGTPIGIVAVIGGEAVAWCSVAPRPTYRRLGGPDDHADAPETVWSIACFYIARAWRGRGLTARLIEAAAAEARRAGATIVEAYPVAPDAPSYRFMGTVPTFAAAGFTAIAPAGTRRTAMRREV